MMSYRLAVLQSQPPTRAMPQGEEEQEVSRSCSCSLGALSIPAQRETGGVEGGRRLTPPVCLDRSWGGVPQQGL